MGHARSRIAVASPRGNEVVVEQAFAVDLARARPTSARPSEVGRQLAAVLAEQGLTGCDALVAVPRSSIELRTLTLPHAPPEEIPDMVRFQAMQAFTSIGDDWPLDYVELDAHEESINVLAAVVSPKLVEQMQEVCAASELKMRCLVLRPFAAVSLLHRYESIDVFRSSLVVDLLPEGADLTAIGQGPGGLHAIGAAAGPHRRGGPSRGAGGRIAAHDRCGSEPDGWQPHRADRDLRARRNSMPR